jgi:3-(3-hydroxy-phenyl)propionate hydroxylase
VSYDRPAALALFAAVPGLCRVMFPVAAGESDELALSCDCQSLKPRWCRAYRLRDRTCPTRHQRVAKTFNAPRVPGRDAAHINNPLGGMGMNGGIHDAINLTARLIEVWKGKAETDSSGTTISGVR